MKIPGVSYISNGFNAAAERLARSETLGVLLDQKWFQEACGNANIVLILGFLMVKDIPSRILVGLLLASTLSAELLADMREQLKREDERKKMQEREKEKAPDPREP